MGTCLPNLSRLFHRLKPPPASPPPQQLRIETYTYSTPAGLDLKVDAHLPLSDPGWPSPAILFFHGGGLLYGDREFILQGLCDDCTARGWAFLSYDYRKLCPFTGHDILADANAAFSHYHTALAPKHNLSVTNVFVAGYSAGGYVAQLAAAHWEPKPLGVFLVAAQGGKMLSPHYFEEKKDAVGEMSEEVKMYLEDGGTRKVASLSQLGEDGTEFERRIKLAREVWKRGLKLDLLTGIKGLSAQMRQACNDECREALIPDEARCLFPELLIDETSPPAYVVHGERDTAVLMEESEALVERLGKRMVMAELLKIEGAAHQTLCFEGIYREYMAGVIPWLEGRCVGDEGEEAEVEVIEVDEV